MILWIRQNFAKWKNMLSNQYQAYALLSSLNAPARLIQHVRLVSEASDQLIRAYQALQVDIDRHWIEIGVIIHDLGKIQHPHELEGTGSAHESSGQKILLDLGVPAHLARCCVSHAAWDLPDVSLEERTVALADKLWKGKRVEELELLVIDEIAQRLNQDRWAVFTILDNVFEQIALDADDRLRRSQV